MPDESSRSPRRRPVDLLFGEDVEVKPKLNTPARDTRAPQAPGYLVEPPRPVTSLRPPPPEFPSDWHVSQPPEQASVMDAPVQVIAPLDLVAPPPKPVMAEPPPKVEPIAEAITFTVSETKPAPAAVPVDPWRPAGTEMPAPALPFAATAIAPTAVASPAPTPLYGQMELVELSQFVDQLYQNVADETSDGAALNTECLTNLNIARQAIEKREYAKAEAAAESVKARLLRARASRTAAAAPTTRALFGWLGAASFIGIVLFVLPFVLRIVPVVIPLMRGAGLGMLGGAAMALWQMSQQISRREYDAEFNTRYTLSPLLGALTGAVLYLLSLLGIVAAPNALGITSEPYALMYLFALLGGVFNDSILGTLRGLVSIATRRKS
jgi:hypothetical protein